MDLLNIFKNDPTGARKSHLKDLITVAMADGRMDESEWELLKALARLMEIPENEISRIREHPDGVGFVPPKKYEDKITQIQDLVALMNIDGEIDSSEVELCKKISLRLDLLPQIVDQILEEIKKAGADPKRPLQA